MAQNGGRFILQNGSRTINVKRAPHAINLLKPGAFWQLICLE